MELDFFNNVTNSGFATSFIPFFKTNFFSRFSSASWINSSNSFGASEFTKCGLLINRLPRLQKNALGGTMNPALFSAKYDSIGNNDFRKIDNINYAQPINLWIHSDFYIFAFENLQKINNKNHAFFAPVRTSETKSALVLSIGGK